MLSLEERLKAIPEVSDVKKLNTSDHFSEKFEFRYEQHVNPNDTTSATFKQKVILCHKDFISPVVVGLEGYEIWTNNAYELTRIVDGNQLSIEHRFFKDSRPEGEIPWEYLTIANAANDQHRIIQKIKQLIYPHSKFVSTGISKGGQTTMIHRSFYPDDVDASVCYVAPLNFEREDPRIYHFLDTVGTQEERDRIEDFQIRCLKKKRKLTKILRQYADAQGLEWDIPIELAMEYYILEYSFAYWQWGAFEMEDIPGRWTNKMDRISHLLAVSGVSFFEKQGVEDLRSYFWAALTEEGIYGYEHEDFSKWLSQENTYLFDFTAPEGTNPTFNPKPMRDLNNFVQTEATEMLFIYGGYDTWYATGVQLSEEAQARGLKKYVMPGGHHDTRIGSFPEATQKEIKEILDLWLDEMN
ncbi:MAG: S28 family serine protease [Crocinitomicaceae bacterium]